MSRDMVIVMRLVCLGSRVEEGLGSNDLDTTSDPFQTDLICCLRAGGSRVASSKKGMPALSRQVNALCATRCLSAGPDDENGRKVRNATMAIRCPVMDAAPNAN